MPATRLGHHLRAFAAALTCLAPVLSAPAIAQRDPRWSSEFALDGFDGPLLAATAFDPDGPGPRLPALFASGRFLTAGPDAMGRSISRHNIARFGPGLDLGIVQQPLDHDALDGDTVILRGRARSSDNVSHQWSPDGQPLADGLHPSGMLVLGAQTDTLVLSNLSPSSAGAYLVAFTTPCGVTLSRAAAVSVRCFADFNSSGVIDPDDLADFITRFFQPCP